MHWLAFSRFGNVLKKYFVCTLNRTKNVHIIYNADWLNVNFRCKKEDYCQLLTNRLYPAKCPKNEATKIMTKTYVTQSRTTFN